MTLSGRRLGTEQEKASDAQHIKAVKAVALAFFDAYLKGDKEALEWLRKKFSDTLNVGDRFEWKE